MENGRRKFDFYETPPHYLKALRDVIGEIDGNAYEPCVGKGNIVQFFDGADWTTNDLDPKRDANTHHDASDGAGDAWGRLGIDWCITNPPFSQELPILVNALRWSRNVAFLGRLSFLEPTEDRFPFWQEWAKRCTVIVLPRYSFRLNDQGKKQTDSMTCAWFVWWAAQKTGSLHVSKRREIRWRERNV